MSKSAVVALFALGLMSCTSDDEVIVGNITIAETELNKTVEWDEVESSITFTANDKWTASVSDVTTRALNTKIEWLTLTVNSGEAGEVKMPFCLSKNDSEFYRDAQIAIHCGDKTSIINVHQNQNPDAVHTMDKSQVENFDKYICPGSWNEGFEKGVDNMLRDDAKWSFWRMKQSEHFFVFWEKGYGEYGLYGTQAGTENTSPKTLDPGDAMYVDIDDLLEKAEEFYRVNIEVLQFAETGKGKSNLDKYKMQIYLHHTTEWMAYGSGYDDTIGALWINPATCKPVGSTIAHEIGHCFQYQVYADAIANGAPRDYSTGWRYEIGQGCGFWEQCAQWQSYQSYAQEAFTTYNFSEFVNNCHRHFTHEHQRYASYFLQWHWASKYGVAEIGRLWRESRKPEDAIQTYQRVHGLSMDELNADLYDYAARCVTWDFSAEATNLDAGKLTGVTQPVREFGKAYIGKIGWTGNLDKETGFYTVDPARAPEATGFNHIRLNMPKGGGSVSVRFEGLPNATGFNKVSNPAIAGWNVGFVCLMKDDSRVYSPSTRVRDNADITWEVPANAAKLWMVVAATPETYLQHLWDEDNSNDEVWPFRVKFTGTDLFGNTNFDGSEKPKSITEVIDLTTSASAGYSGTALTLDEDTIFAIAQAFVLQPNDIIAKLTTDINNVRKSEIKFLAVKADGTLDNSFLAKDADSYYSANGFGFWFDKAGANNGWSSGYSYLEYDPSSWTCQFGVHPDRVKDGSIKAGDVLSIAVAFVYGNYTATLKFNITITD